VRDPRICASIPSSRAAFDLVSPDAAAIPAVLATWLGRAALIGTGLVIARHGDGPNAHKHVVRDSLYAAVALEGFLLLYAYHRTHGEGRADALREHAPQLAT
jgi:hypothetical protein